MSKTTRISREDQIEAWLAKLWNRSRTGSGAKYLIIRGYAVSVVEVDLDKWGWRIKKDSGPDAIIDYGHEKSEEEAKRAVLEKHADKLCHRY